MNSSEYYEKLGMVASLKMGSDAYRKHPIGSLIESVKVPILLEQIHFFHDLAGNLAGYMTWAFLAEDVERKWISDPLARFHISEWNEGDRLWIADFLVLGGEPRHFVDFAFKELFQGHVKAMSLRRKPDGTVYKISTWKRRR